MGFFSGLVDTITGGDILGIGAGLLGGASSDSSARAASKTANQFTEKQLKNRHQWEVEDLKKAGLNPILSAGSAPSIGSSAKADVTNKADAMSKTGLMRAQLENIEADTTLKGSTSANQLAQAKLAGTTDTKSGATSGIYKTIGRELDKIPAKASSAKKAVKKGAKTFWDYANPSNLYTIPRDVYKQYNKGKN